MVGWGVAFCFADLSGSELGDSLVGSASASGGVATCADESGVFADGLGFDAVFVSGVVEPDFDAVVVEVDVAGVGDVLAAYGAGPYLPSVGAELVECFFA